ncbi:MAG: GNAT family N-acetyltransferase [Actinomycetota bacterium]
MIIRPYREKDYEETKRLCVEFMALIKDLLPEELYRFEALADNGLDYWLSDAVKPAKGFFVAEADPGRLAGFVQGYFEDDKSAKLSRWGIIDALFVAASFRGHGVGRDLYKALEEWFAAQGCVAARVETWLTNTPAIEAYQAMGFKPFYTGFVKEI